VRGGVLLALIFLALCSEILVARDSVLSQVRGVKDVSIPLGDVEGLPTVIFRCGEIATEKRRLGVLRLGILPRYVFRDVVIEVTGRGEENQWMEDLSGFVSSEPLVRQARLDKISFRRLGTKSEIEAEQAGFHDFVFGGEIRLRGVVHREPDGTITRLPEAVILCGSGDSGANELTVTRRVRNDPHNRSVPVISLQ
jgi:hypothetical protein